MSVSFDEKRQTWRWQFCAVIDGERHRLSKTLPKNTTEAQARRFDDSETARTYARLTTGRRVSTVALIETAVTHYLTEVAATNKDGKKAARQLAELAQYYTGKGLDQLGAVSRAFLKDHTNLAPATRRQRLAYLKSAANHALERHGLGSADWIAQITMPKVKNDREVIIDRANLLRAARKCKHRGTRALVLLTFATGSRPGECYRADATEDALVMQETKNGSRHVAPVPPHLRRYLRHWPFAHDYTYYSADWRQARETCGLPDVHLHDLRHSTASALLKDGASLAQIGMILNHTSAQSTKRYAHLATQEKARLLESLWQKTPRTKQKDS